MRLTLKTINGELARRGHQVLLARGDGYFYFWTGEAAEWLDRTVRASKLSDLTLLEWIEEYQNLKRKNRQIREQAGRRPKKQQR